MESRIINPKVSVIIPVYNIEDYIQKCIESVIHQTLLEIEIILIDDGSTDKSGAICDEYAEKDKRIKVVHKANQGLSCARNDGIDISVAPYIMFVDGDDWVEPLFCELPYKIASEQNVDLVMFSYNVVYQDGNVVHKKTKIHGGHLTKEQALYNNVFVANAAWLALYRKQLFKEIRFPVWKLYEDVGTIHRLIYKSCSWYLVNEPLYYHRIGRQGSITTEPSTKNHQDLIDMFAYRIHDLLEWGYDDFAHKLALSLLIRYGTCETFFLNVAKQTHQIKSSNLKHKIMIRILRFSPSLFDFICVISGRRVNRTTNGN